jgi:glycosyltransferase involved in cell wall biosynthesis
MKKILYFYPENPLHLTQGNNTRAMGLLKYFKIRNFDIDFVGDSIYVSELHIEELKEKKLINNGFLLKKYTNKNNKIKYLKSKIFKKKKQILDRVADSHQEIFNEILKNNEYDYIIISYVFWTRLIENSVYLKKSKLIIDTHDFMSPYFKDEKDYNVGNYFKKEIKKTSYFDKVLVVSIEEKYIFSQFLDNEVHLISHPEEIKNKSGKEIYDVVYVASDNIHNEKSAKWFFSKVYPLLPICIRICVVGKVNIFLPSDLSNVDNLLFVEDLHDVYSVSKIAICPMLSGTGVKIKVIEALSYGLPIVCNERGVDGLSNKSQNGCLVTNDENIFATFIEKLINDEIYYNKISAQAKENFLINHEKSIVYNELDKVFN